MSIATITASDILPGKQGDPDSFSIAHFDIAEAEDRIDALISSDHFRPHYMRVDMPAVWYRLLATSVEAACQLTTKEAIPHITLMQCREKFGELRLLLAVEGSAALKAEIETITD